MDEPPVKPAPYLLVALCVAVWLLVVMAACSATDRRLWPGHYGWDQPAIGMDGQAPVADNQV